MHFRKTGQFYGVTSKTLRLQEMTLTDTEYTEPKVDWHYHENAYFTFILEGKVLEGNKKETYHCGAGDLLFHHWQEPHFNIKPAGFTRGFHLELRPGWFRQFDLPENLLEGSHKLIHPHHRLLFYRLFAAFRQYADQPAVLDSLLVDLFADLGRTPVVKGSDFPRWVLHLEQLLFDEPESRHWRLNELAAATAVHPVHLSRAFPSYFGHRLSDVLQAMKLHQAMRLLSDDRHNLAAIAAECGFADQSHFIRAFRKSQGMTPLAYRRLLR
ncbi:helix-turn-helix transcriptional regulator [Flavihumibacter petaseus]|uniref:Putative AraC family transcriptional regulator n=1 Tax=Flavihumibacter petaseus NBRC 106054 TaxID=1220578 RepID=A0A0E9N058_9BACT|nr:helix-turn-helix transcriptional regulator [Flavihumibacter petaseus]GAO43377.1 putative AraC family transcriptional regulator [Flavihumibacter petaseus NBRC 106054]